MAQVLIRGLSEEAIASWRSRAKRHNRSLEAELRELIERDRAVDATTFEEAVRFADEMRKKYASKVKDDSTALIRADRDR